MKLQFYKKGIPLNSIKRIVILLLIFCSFVVIFEITTNYKKDVVTVEMTKPTIPTIDIHYLDLASTSLHGYITEMNPCYMRDAIIPLGKDRLIEFSMDTKHFKIDDLSYEIRSLDTQRKIASNDIKFKEKSNTLTATIQAENLIDTGEEYLLIITAKNDDRNIRYYTRIMRTEDCHEKEIVQFATDFHNTALSDNADELSTFIEPKAYAKSDSLYKVNINSPLSMINYGKFNGKQEGPAYITLTDIGANYISLTMTYFMKSGDNRKPTYYDCQENFRVRYTPERFYLLDYNRTMEQQLDKNSVVFKDNTVKVGITDKDVQYLSNETGSIIAFVQNGSLFEYNQTDRCIKEIFNFITDDPTDIRATYDQHQIHILNIDESGTMDFVVYGYMNCGAHEGESGVNLFHYDAIEDVSTEQVFIASTNSYQILNANFSDLIYETSNNQFYIMVNGTLVHMSLNQLTTDELLTGLDETQYAVSGSGRFVAWTETPITADVIHILDLETQKTFDITSKEDELLKPLAFMDEDFIYGSIFKSQITKDAAGSVVYPMHKLTISEISNNEERVLMTYKKSGKYVTDVSIDSYTLYLKRVSIDANGNVKAARDDTIMNSSGEQNQAIPITTAMDRNKGEVVILNMTQLGDNENLGKVDYKYSDLSLAENSRTITVSTDATTTKYFVYTGNSVTLATDNLTNAIESASKNMGVVLNNVPEYVWKCGRKPYQNDFTNLVVGSSDNEADGNAQALSAMLVYAGENVQVHTLLETGDTPMSILSRTLKDYTVLDLTGLDVENVLYYIGIGSPVYAKTDENNAESLAKVTTY